MKIIFKYIVMERTGSFGLSPVYKVRVDNAGNVEWEGKRFVAFKGIYQWKISASKVAQINSLLSEFDYMSFEYLKDFNEIITCLPSCITCVKYLNGDIKRIDHYLGDDVDPRLTFFEESLDKILGTRKYIKHRN